MKLFRQIAALLLIFAAFAAFNGSMYALCTSRLSNNFSGATQMRMVDVGRYLPFEEGSDLPEIDSSLRLSGALPVLDGAAALVPVYASVIENVYPAGCVAFEGGSFSDDNYYGENFAPESVMQYQNTVRGYKAIVDGGTDLFFSAGPSEEQKAYAAEKGVELIYVPVGLEAFVFFVNRKNPVEDLSSEEIRRIYSGEIRNWAALGGPNRVINPVTRLSGSGSQTMFEHFMGDAKIGRKSPFALAGGSIGFSFRYYLEGMVQNGDVKMISLDGVYPNGENIRNRTYPVVTPFYAIYRADNPNENIPRLVDWLLSEEGQTLIEKTGYARIR